MLFHLAHYFYFGLGHWFVDNADIIKKQ